MEPVKIEVTHGSFRYPGETRTVLDGLSFQAEAGDVLAILGPNGAGKTTLLRCMMGLLPWHKGQTLLDGVPLSDIPQKELWKRISYVPQARQALAAYTVEEMVLLGRTACMGRFSLPGKADREMTRDVLRRLGLEEIARRKCSALSGGEFQMVLIARALVSEPEILVLDEPESNLDFKNQLLVLDTISALAAEGITCIFNTHYPAHALRRGTRALMLGRDGAYRFGPVREIITEESLAAFFGVQSVIGDVETPGRLYQDVIPVSIGETAPRGTDPKQRVIAGVTVILPIESDTGPVNRLLHEYSGLLIGRMGLPYRKAGLSIIHLTLDCARKDAMALTDGLGRIPGVSVKTTYATEAGTYES